MVSFEPLPEPIPPFDWSSSDWLLYANRGFGGSGVSASLVDATAGKATIGSNFRAYWSGWHGNQYVSTAKLASIAKFVGTSTLVAGTALDMVGVRNYYMDGPDAPNTVHPGHAAANLGIGVWALGAGPPGALVAGAYYGIETFYPGGFVGAMTDQARIIEQNQAINPRFNLYRDFP